MKSLRIEFYRYNNLSVGMLREGDSYIVATANNPVRTCEMSLNHGDFLDLMRALRYEGSPEERRTSLDTLRNVVTDLLAVGSLKELETGDFPLHLDLLVNAAELAPLPFEAIADRAGQPLLICEQRPIELTRRVRNQLPETAATWPVRPRILFAWACPPQVNDVPYREHEKALRAALRPWLPFQGTGNGNVLVILERIDLASLKNACANSVADEKPFSHVHILAHGYPIKDRWKKRFGLALHDQDGSLATVTPEELTTALAPLCDRSVVVTLATCDSANTTSSPEKSIAHGLHNSGFPVVVASQLPLTVSGSNILVERFYGAMLAGRDVRTALHEARIALYAEREKTGHDWVSLVGYVRLPEGYGEHLSRVRLDGVLTSLDAAQKRSDEIIDTGENDLAEFDRVADYLQGYLGAFENLLRETGLHGLGGGFGENVHLLGNGERCLAELCFARGQRMAGDDDWKREMRCALTRSRDWYRQGYEHNLSHHWLGVRYLSLAAALDSQIVVPGLWQAAAIAAELDGKRQPQNPRPWGSLAELYLLAPFAGQPWQEAAAGQALDELKARAQAKSDLFPIETTERQLRRYTHWWTTANGFFPGTSDLAAVAEGLIQRLLAA